MKAAEGNLSQPFTPNIIKSKGGHLVMENMGVVLALLGAVAALLQE